MRQCSSPPDLHHSITYGLRITTAALTACLITSLARAQDRSSETSPLHEGIPCGALDREVLPEHAILRLGRNPFPKGPDNTAAAFGPDDRHVLVSNTDGELSIWNAYLGRRCTPLGKVRSLARTLAWSPQGDTALSIDDTGRMEAWDVQKRLQRWSVNAPDRMIHDATFNPQGNLILLACDTVQAGPHAIYSAPRDEQLKLVLTLWDAGNGQMVRMMPGHEKSVNAVRFSPSGKIAATGSQDQTVRLWDVATGNLLKSFTGLQNSIVSVLFTPDERQLVTGTVFGPLRSTASGRIDPTGPPGDDTVIVWDISSGKQVRTFPIKTTAGQIAISPDAQAIFVENNLLDFSTGKETGSLNFGYMTPGDVKFCSNGKHLLVTRRSGPPLVYDLASQSWLRTAFPHFNKITTTRYSPDCRKIFMGDEDGMASLWDAHSGQMLHSWKATKGRIEGASFVPDGKLLAISGDGPALSVWDVEAPQRIAQVKSKRTFSRSLAISPDGRLAATEDDEFVKLWEIPSMAPHSQIRTSNKIWSLAFSPKDQRLITGGDNGEIESLNSDSGQRNWSSGRLLPGSVYTVSFSPDGRHILAGGWYGDMILLNAETGEVVRRLEGRRQRNINQITFSPDGRHMASASTDHTVEIWDPWSGKMILTLEGHTDSATSIDFSPDGKSLVSGSADHTAIVWKHPD